MIRRNIASEIQDALRDTPVVLITGARQVGKSTLAQDLVRIGFGGSSTGRYLTFDNATVLAAAESDPDGFIHGLSGPTVIDEVQRVPGIFRAIMAQVDANRTPGRFLLTGSADVLLIPSVSESLAGRIELQTLWPFSQGELEGRKETFIDTVFGEKLPAAVPGNAIPIEDLWLRIATGGYPEIHARKIQKRRSRWYESYITTILQRDIRDLANIEGINLLPALLQLVASRMAGIMNYSELARTVGLPGSTVKRYLTLLEATYLIRRVPAWSANLSKRLVKSPKGILSDTGLAMHLVRSGFSDSIADQLRGPFTEAFVTMEIEKQRSWADRRVTQYHFRTARGKEIDLILEDTSGKLVGIEVKSSTNVSGADFAGLRTLMDLRPRSFHRGIVLYAGNSIVSFDTNLHAVPISAVWRW